MVDSKPGFARAENRNLDYVLLETRIWGGWWDGRIVFAGLRRRGGGGWKSMLGLSRRDLLLWEALY